MHHLIVMDLDSIFPVNIMGGNRLDLALLVLARIVRGFLGWITFYLGCIGFRNIPFKVEKPLFVERI